MRTFSIATEPAEKVLVTSTVTFCTLPSRAPGMVTEGVSTVLSVAPPVAVSVTSQTVPAGYTPGTVTVSPPRMVTSPSNRVWSPSYTQVACTVKGPVP